ncbi:MAG TPA: methyltransferase domain-containing protein [Candidatus Omnitrophota bacterium]|nr:methyltransferase domain-containing protein [Candidatus Omnitrophota bacterium]
MVCTKCTYTFPMRYGIPALMPSDHIDSHSNQFLGAKKEPCASRSPYTLRHRKIYHVIIAEVLYCFCVLNFIRKYGFRNIIRKNWCHEVKRALFFGWTNYFNLILKAGEIGAFNTMSRYIQTPSLEIGCGNCYTSNMIFRDKLDSVTFGCEYFMDTFLTDGCGQTVPSGLSTEMFKLIQWYVGGSIKALPFTDGSLKSVYMVHIIDHIEDTDTWFKEINRILATGGYLVMTGYSRYVFENLPGVKFRSRFSKQWAENYKNKRITRENPYRGGIPLSTKDSYYYTGRNIFSLSEWKKLAESYQFDVVDHRFFGKNFSYFVDMEYNGYAPSYIVSELIYSGISKMIEGEKEHPLSEEDSTNLILVLRKKKGLR